MTSREGAAGEGCRVVIHERTELKAQWGESGVLGASQMWEKDPESFWFLPRMCPEHSYTDVWSQVGPSKPLGHTSVLSTARQPREQG